VQRDQDHELGRTDVITEPTAVSRPEALQAKTTFHQDKMYYLSPFELATVGSLPAYILGEEDRGHYKDRLATTIEGVDSFSPPSTREVVHPLYLFILSPS
jgi:hypothetical protein